jgi:hypothetical protein
MDIAMRMTRFEACRIMYGFVARRIYASSMLQRDLVSAQVVSS